jgi:hypothetical protein
MSKRGIRHGALCLVASVLALACGDATPPSDEPPAPPGLPAEVQVDSLSTYNVTLTDGSATQSGCDFVAGRYDGNSGGDLYFTQGQFWANNAGQRGVAPVGACTSVAAVTALPTTGFSIFGVTATAGNCYVALSHSSPDYAVFRVNSVTSTQVQLTYEVVTSPDWVATMVSGDSWQGGYDFTTKSNLGLSGGDLYFVSGSFWANNYDERGVVSLGPCSSVDAVTSVSSTSFNRFGVAATVGNCYASPLHANNREYAVFRVQSLTSTTVGITWKLLPVPISQMAWQHCERWHNPRAVASTTTTATLSNWLAQNSSIASAMQWISPVVANPPQTVGYTSWPSAMQTALLQNFVNYWAWYTSGMTGTDPTPVTDPPPNQHTTSNNDVLTVLAPSDAQALYLKYLALTFVVELQGQVPWSLLQLDTASLAELLDSRKFFTQYGSGGYDLIPMSVVPAPPLVAAKYVSDHNLLCSTRPETIAEAVFWARNLQHFQTDLTNFAQDERDFWQYAGNPPASRVLSGTKYSGTRNTGSYAGVPTNLTQWTMGCHGTTGLLKSLLRTLNIPVEHFSNGNPSVTLPNNSFIFSGHATLHFTADHLWLSHADDPYFLNDAILPFPLQALEIGDTQFFAWYPNTGAASTVAPGRQQDNLWVDYGDQFMPADRLKDLQTKPTPPDLNICAYVNSGTSENYYTCSQAEAMGLLSMLDPLVTPYLAGGSLSSDMQSAPYCYDTEPQFRAPPCDTCVPAACAENAACCGSWSFSCGSLAYQICKDACSN